MFVTIHGGLFRQVALASTLASASLILAVAARAQNNSTLANDISTLTQKLTPEATKDGDVQRRVKEFNDKFVQDEDSFGVLAQSMGASLKTVKDKLTKPQSIMSSTQIVVSAVDGIMAERFSKDKIAPNVLIDVMNQVDGAYKAVVSIDEHLDKATAAERQITHLIDALGKLDKASLKSESLIKAAGALRTGLAAVAPTFKINILGAWFGDSRFIRRNEKRLLNKPFDDGNHLCSATRVVRTTCQAADACAFPISDGSVTTELTGISLCKYEPAAYSADRFKALHIKFQCIPASSSLWTDAPADNPRKLESKPGEPPVNEAVLRGTGKVEFRCQPKQPAG